MELNLNKLNEIAQPRSNSAIMRAEARKKSSAWRAMSQDVALAMLYYLRKNGMTQKQLAEKMGVSPAQVAKLVRGTENLKLETIAKIEEALETQIVYVARPYEESSISNSAFFTNNLDYLKSSHYTGRNAANASFASADNYNCYAV